MNIKCSKCGCDCTLGINAVVTLEGNQCDNCAGIVRGLGGYAFEGDALSLGDHCTCYEIVGDNNRCPLHGAMYQARK